ncbi:hypothetical protein [Faecalicatena orotica]|uniref:hypothetical protein n=1 Tax=Faecalicatena orotica TaxID=1544 RepID=UPI003217C097
MSSFVDTDTEPLYRLKNQLERFREQTEYMQMFTGAELDEFEREIGQQSGGRKEDDDFRALWGRYENCRELFQERVDRLLKHEIVNREGERNIYTLISILETYFDNLI